MNGIEVSFDPAWVDRDCVYRWLSDESHWARGIARATFERSLDNSLVVGAYADAEQIGFARVVTDYATFGYLCDVFVASARRGKGIGSALVAALLGHPGLQGLRRIALRTKDAQALYARFGFDALATPALWMERYNPHFLPRQITP